MEQPTRSAVTTGASRGLAYTEMVADQGFDRTEVARGVARPAEAVVAPELTIDPRGT